MDQHLSTRHKWIDNLRWITILTKEPGHLLPLLVFSSTLCISGSCCCFLSSVACVQNTHC